MAEQEKRELITTFKTLESNSEQLKEAFGSGLPFYFSTTPIRKSTKRALAILEMMQDEKPCHDDSILPRSLEHALRTNPNTILPDPSKLIALYMRAQKATYPSIARTINPRSNRLSSLQS